jgi:hypothetical protein
MIFLTVSVLLITALWTVPWSFTFIFVPQTMSLLRIPLIIITSSVALSISTSLILAILMTFTSWVSSCLLPLVSTIVISFTSFGIFMALSIVACSSLVPSHFSFMLTLMLLGFRCFRLQVPLLIVSSSFPSLLPRRPRSWLLLTLVLSLSCVLWPTWLLRWLDYSGSLLILVRCFSLILYAGAVWQYWRYQYYLKSSEAWTHQTHWSELLLHSICCIGQDYWSSVCTLKDSSCRLTNVHTQAQYCFLLFKLNVVDPPWVWDRVLKICICSCSPIFPLYILSFGPSNIGVLSFPFSLSVIIIN